MAQVEVDATSGDWQGRYDHIDQILNTPGPRTDAGFLAGDGASITLIILDDTRLVHLQCSIYLGKGFLEE